MFIKHSKTSTKETENDNAETSNASKKYAPAGKMKFAVSGYNIFLFIFSRFRYMNT